MALKANKISNSVADNYRLVKGKYVKSAGGAASTLDGDYIVVELPRGAFLHGAYIDIKTAIS